MSPIRKITKTIVAASLACLLASSMFLVSCSQSTGNTSAKSNTITLMGKETDLAKSYLQKIIKLYEDKTGNKIELISVPDVDYNTEVDKRLASKDIPDIMLHFNNSALKDLDVKDNFVYLNDQEWSSELTQASLEYCTDSSGNLLGLPFWENSVSGCYYNKTVLDALGLKPATTQAEFDRLCAAIKSAGHTPLFWGDDSCSWMYQFALDPIFAQRPELIDQLNSGQIKYSDIPEIKSMIEWIANAFANGWIDMDKNGKTWNDMSLALNDGDALMIDIWDTWFDTDFVPAIYTKNDFAVMPVFMGTDETGTYEGGNLNMMMVCKNSTKIEQALEFLNFCATPDNYNIAFERISSTSVFKNQTTNVESQMATDAKASIEKEINVSTADTRIKGYDAGEVAEVIMKLINGQITTEQCIDELDQARLS